MNYLKSFVLFILLLGVAAGASAQKRVFGVPNLTHYDSKIYHFGFSLSGGSYTYIISTNPDLRTLDGCDSLRVVNPRSGKSFGFGIISDLRMGKYFDLRFIPSFSFPDCHIDYYCNSDVPNTNYANGSANGIVFLDLPLLVKFKSTRMMNNVRAYVVAGAQYSFNLVYSKAKDIANMSANEVLLVNAHDVMAQVGVGFDFYCTYFKLATELKFSLGLMNQLQQEGKYEGAINSLRSKGFQVSITFE